MEDYHQLLHDRVKQHYEHLGRMVDYIETGVCTGNSAEAVLSTNCVRFAVLVDHFSNGNYCGHEISAERVAERLKPYDGLFEIVKGDSKNILPHMVDEFDIAFVDGDHSREGCWFDMDHILKRIRPDGIMFVDDLDGSGLKQIVEQFAEQNKLEMKYHKVHEGLGELTRK